MLRRFNITNSFLRRQNNSNNNIFSSLFEILASCSSSSSTLLTPEQQKLFSQLPEGWKQIEFQAPVQITTQREADEDGIVHRPEAEHRRIFSPYATSSPFSGPSTKTTTKKRSNNNNNNNTTEEEGEATEIEATTNNNDKKEDILYVSKHFSFGQFGPLYHWMGRVGAMAEKVNCFPDFDWFFLGCTATVPLTPDGLHLAWYMNDEEAVRGANRNTSEGTLHLDSEKSLASDSNNPFALPDELRKTVEKQAVGEFCWLIAGDSTQRELFTSEIYLQWYHRADYLVSRKAKEATEYRNNLTLEQVLQSASQNRKRRRERKEEIQTMKDKFKPLPESDLPPHYLRFRSRKERETARKMSMFGMDGRDGSQDIKSSSDVNAADVQEMTPSRTQFVIDTLPREVRERLEADDDGNSAHGFGGGIRQQDPIAYARNSFSSSNQSGFGGSGLHSGGSFH
jgi:hypothetical protein